MVLGTAHRLQEPRCGLSSLDLKRLQDLELPWPYIFGAVPYGPHPRVSASRLHKPSGADHSMARSKEPGGLWCSLPFQVFLWRERNSLLVVNFALRKRTITTDALRHDAPTPARPRVSRARTRCMLTRETGGGLRHAGGRLSCKRRDASPRRSRPLAQRLPQACTAG